MRKLKISPYGAAGILGLILALIALVSPQFGLRTRASLLISSAVLGALAILFADFGSWARPWVRTIALIVWLGLTGFWIRGVIAGLPTLGVASSPTPYPALLDCFPDARISAHRTVKQQSIPTDVVYVTIGSNQEITSGEARPSGESGPVLKLNGMFIQCSLKNEGATDLKDVSLKFYYTFAAGFTMSRLGPALVYSPANPPIRSQAIARRVLLKAGHTFSFAIVNFDERLYGFLGIPVINGDAPILPVLSYRRNSSDSVVGNQALTLTCRAKSALVAPMYPAQTSGKPKPWKITASGCSSAGSM